jgi:hypothetical protein
LPPLSCSLRGQKTIQGIFAGNTRQPHKQTRPAQLMETEYNFNRYEDYDENFQRKMREKELKKKFRQNEYGLDGYRKTIEFKFFKYRAAKFYSKTPAVK